jgi:hypothetical protein
MKYISLKHLRLFAICTLLSIGIISCSETTSVDTTAEQLSLQELRTAPGYSWFDAESTHYDTDTLTVAEIATALENNNCRVYAYVKTSCTCVGTQKLFPRVMKVLTDAKLSEDQIEIFSMRAPSNEHPHMSTFDVQSLPSIFIVMNDSATPTLITNLPDEPAGVEKLVLEAVTTQ